MKAGTNVWWLIPWEMFTHVCIFICQNFQASDEGWYQCVVANSMGNVYPCMYFICQNIQASDEGWINVWWLIPWEMLTPVCIFICQNIQASDEGWYQCVVANSVGNVSENAFIKVQGKNSLFTLNLPIATKVVCFSRQLNV